MQSIRKKAITMKFLSLLAKNVKSSENILLEIFNSNTIVEFNSVIYFQLSKYKIITIILRQNNKYTI